jgi:signal transduction histidine kinase
MSPDDESKAILERALSTADRIIVEGRNRVGSLRSEHVTDAELVGALTNAGKELNVDQKVQYSVVRTGIVAALQPHVADEVFFAAREAVTNAFRHARASHISLELTYGARYFNMVCKDDGRGFGPEEQERRGYWGLQGIAERAQNVGGQTRVLSKPGAGTEIILAIPSYRACRGCSRLTFYLRAWRLAERSPVRRKRTSSQTAG